MGAIVTIDAATGQVTRVIPLPLSTIASSRVIGVAGGVHTAHAILGALRGGFLDVLVTNELAAIRLLELEQHSHKRGTTAV